MPHQHTLQHATSLLNQAQFDQALVKIESILNVSPSHSQALKLKVKLGFTSKQLNLAEQGLKQLQTNEPENFQYVSILESLYSQESRWLDICQLYSLYTVAKPNHAIGQFNYAYYLKLTGSFEKAIEHYERALALNISDSFEVYLNIAVIYNEHLNQTAHAIDILLDAKVRFPSKDAIVYNLANIYEQIGDKENALVNFQLAFAINPKNHNALARQADISRNKSPQTPLVDSLLRSLMDPKISVDEKINVGYALGKTHDDCQEYSRAFEFYQQANNLNAQTLPPYNKVKIEQQVDAIISTFTAQWFSNQHKQQLPKQEQEGKRCPTFICGMFRSGSTLCEQILAAHPQVKAGGEQEFFHRTIKTQCADFPNNVINYISINSSTLKTDYFNEIYKSIDDTKVVTDKRPDNFLYIGLIKSILPTAKIIWTKRQLLDNCLSVYFLRLGATMNYATDVANIIHFYHQQERLMMHWSALFPKDIYIFDYDKLIATPTESINHLLDFMALPFDESCLDFHQVENQVKTASVWQVRQPLYKGSSSRWLNYRTQLEFVVL